jgi:hypothetical protein
VKKVKKVKKKVNRNVRKGKGKVVTSLQTEVKKYQGKQRKEKEARKLNSGKKT